MENASKALIIAGAILLSIAIIGLGMAAFNSVSDVTDTDPTKEIEIQQFNSKFDPYLGENVNGSRVKTLLSTIRTHNLTEEDETRRVGIETSKVTKGREDISASDVQTASAEIKTGKTYKVTFTYDDNTGFISSIKIEENAKSGS